MINNDENPENKKLPKKAKKVLRESYSFELLGNNGKNNASFNAQMADLDIKIKRPKKFKFEKGKTLIEKRLKSNNITPLIKLEKIIFQNFINNYKKPNFYNVQKINEIINNEKSHVVAKFKDFLVLGDMAEFILEYFPIENINVIFPQILDYYNENLFIFPNYVSLPESKYIYNNIQKKQKIIDIQEENNNVDNNKKEKESEKEEKIKNIFSFSEIDSLLNQTNTSGIKQYFGMSLTDTKNSNSVDKNDKNIQKLIDNINNIEQNCSVDKNKKIKSNDILKKKYIFNEEQVSRNKNKKTSTNNNYGDSLVKLNNQKKNNSNNIVLNKGIYHKTIINSVNKNKGVENPKKCQNNTLDSLADISRHINQSQMLDTIFNKNKKEQKIFNKLVNNYDIFPNKNNNKDNILTKFNKIKINSNSQNEIISNNNNFDKKSILSGKKRNFKKIIMNSSISSNMKSSNDIIPNVKFQKEIRNNINSEIIDKYSSMNQKEKSFSNTNLIILKNEKNKNSKNREKSQENWINSGYKNKNLKNELYFNKNRHTSYKLKSNKTNQLMSNPNHNEIDYLLYEEMLNKENLNNIKNRPLSKTIFINNNKKMRLKSIKDNNNGHNQTNKKITNNNNTMSIPKLKNKSTYEYNKNRNFPITERKILVKNDLNFDNLEVLVNKIQKMKDIKSQSEKNIFSFILDKQKSISTKNIENKDGQKFINYNNNIIKVYLVNKTRNKTKKRKNSSNYKSMGQMNDSIKSQISNSKSVYKNGKSHSHFNNYQTVIIKGNNYNVTNQKKSLEGGVAKNRKNVFSYNQYG